MTEKLVFPTLQVDAQGRIFSAGGEGFTYNTPKDLDGDGAYDFLEAGGGITEYKSFWSLLLQKTQR